MVCMMVSRPARPSTIYMFEGVETVIISPTSTQLSPLPQNFSSKSHTVTESDFFLQEKQHPLSLKKLGSAKKKFLAFNSGVLNGLIITTTTTKLSDKTFRYLIKLSKSVSRISHFWETRGNGNESASTSSENNKQREQWW